MTTPATDLYEQADAETAPLLRRFVLEHPFVAGILGGQLTRPAYAAYLRETYHLVRQTPRYLAAAAARADEPWLRDWFLDLAVDERGHDKLCVHDLRKMDIAPEPFLAGQPGLGSWTMISQNHFLATSADPAGILGFAVATEGLGASLAVRAARAMQRYDFARPAMSFLKVHSTEDQDHIARARQAFNRCADVPERRELMLAAWKYTLRAYGQLFSDALAGGDGDASAPPAGVGAADAR